MQIQAGIEQKLREAFAPEVLQVENESYKHSVPAGAESHFKVILVCQQFEGQRLLVRHRAVNTVLSTELSGQIHALALHTYSPTEWQQLGTIPVPASPDCLGGSKRG